jgi:serine phosphatase RsbU (regulator of sigma subunit)
VSERIRFLKQTELFQSVPEGLLESIDGHLSEVRLSAGGTLFNEGDIGDAVYVIRDGVVLLRSGGVDLLARRRGECVGEFALIDDGPRSATAAAESDAVLYRWDRQRFQETLSRNAEVARGIFRMLTGKLRQEVEGRVVVALEQERWRQDLARAREIQAGMLPADHLERPEIEIAGYCSPAAEVGGDFYDYIEFGPNEVGVIIGDVTGHGFYSGLFVAMAKSCVHTQARVAHTPAAIMMSLRRALSLSIQRRLLMTCCYVAFDLERNTLRYANAGHPYPCHLRPSTGEITRLEALDTILGVLDIDTVDLEERELEWRPGDLLLLYSDGVSEARDADGNMFDESGIEAAVVGCLKGSAVEVRAAVLDAVTRHAGGVPQGDDVTLVVVKAGEAGAGGKA